MVNSNLFTLLNMHIHDLRELSRYTHIFDMLPISIYWKDKEGKYVGRNRYAVEQMMFQSGDHVLDRASVFSKTDSELFSPETAELFRANDLMALAEPDKTFHFVETLKQCSGEDIENVSVKRALLDENNNPCGIFGCTVNVEKFIQPDKSLQEIIKRNLCNKLHKLILRSMGSDLSLNLLQEIKDLMLYVISLNPENKELEKLLLLTSREVECMLLLLKGYSAKSIASFLKISHRTAEIHLERCREKLNFPYKSELASWLWDAIAHL